jgi:hypothetical protein
MLAAARERGDTRTEIVVLRWAEIEQEDARRNQARTLRRRAILRRPLRFKCCQHRPVIRTSRPRAPRARRRPASRSARAAPPGSGGDSDPAPSWLGIAFSIIDDKFRGYDAEIGALKAAAFHQVQGQDERPVPAPRSTTSARSSARRRSPAQAMSEAASRWGFQYDHDGEGR